jgi:hypothetical protein
MTTLFISVLNLRSQLFTLTLILWSLTTALSQNGPTCDTYVNKTTANGLGNNYVYGVYVVGSTVYAATNSGLSISTDGGNTFSNKTTSDGLGSNSVSSVYAVGNTIYVTTYGGGLSISTDGGATFTTKTVTDGLGSNYVYGVYAVGNIIYAATGRGLSISTNGGVTFINKTANGLGSSGLQKVYVIGNTIYAATFGSGLVISTDGGVTFTNRTMADGLGDSYVYDVYVVGSTVYAATNSGLSISTNGGTTFTNKTTANGLGSNSSSGVYAVGNTIYVTAFQGGLSISTNGGISFVNKTTANGLGNTNAQGVNVVGNTIYVATLGGVSFCTSIPLPVTLSYFGGRMTTQGAVLGWSTAREVNNVGFQVERSLNALTFESIGSIPTQAIGGNSTTNLTYAFTDQQPQPGINYYRLIQTDRDGTYTRSKIIALSKESQPTVLYPNPVAATGEAVLEPAQPYSRYVLTDVLGQVLQQSDVPGQLSRLSLAGLASGVYVLRLETTDGIINTFRLVQP